MKKRLRIVPILMMVLAISCNSISQENVEKIYYDNGNIKRINYYQNDSIIKCEFFRNDKSLEGRIIIENNTKHISTYDKNNTIEGEFVSINGKKQGKGKVYNGKGNIVVVWNYLDDKKHGKQIFYNDDGSIERYEYYEHGKLIKEEVP